MSRFSVTPFLGVLGAAVPGSPETAVVAATQIRETIQTFVGASAFSAGRFSPLAQIVSHRVPIYRRVRSSILRPRTGALLKGKFALPAAASRASAVLSAVAFAAVDAGEASSARPI